METYLIPILLFAGLGLLAGITLTAVSRIFAVEKDERTEQIEEILPHANCGACGYAGCADYAAAVVTQDAPTNRCQPGGAATAARIAQIMGKAAERFREEKAFLQCRGTCQAVTEVFAYEGASDCRTANRLYGGNSSCPYGCLGLGDCLRACAYDAITLENGIAVFHPERCTACGQCIRACPKGLIALRPVTQHHTVQCSSRANGKQTKLACKNGCIGCRLCERKCLHKAITVTDNVARIDYSKCTSCGTCLHNCPTGAIGTCEPDDED